MKGAEGRVNLNPELAAVLLLMNPSSLMDERIPGTEFSGDDYLTSASYRAKAMDALWHPDSYIAEIMLTSREGAVLIKNLRNLASDHVEKAKGMIIEEEWFKNLPHGPLLSKVVDEAVEGVSAPFRKVAASLEKANTSSKGLTVWFDKLDVLEYLDAAYQAEECKDYMSGRSKQFRGRGNL